MNSNIYLDFAAATPLDKRVFAVMEPYLSGDDGFYNPSAMYEKARDVRREYETARATLAAQIGAKPYDILLTAGATESVNLALQGVVRANPGSSIAASAIEHQAVLAVAKQFPHSIIEVDKYGRVSEAALRAAVDDTTAVVSIGMVNSEIGTKQPIKDLSKTLAQIRTERKQRGVTMPLYFHTDASQAAGSEDLQVSRLGVDLMTLSSGKIYGPKQTGLLYAHRNVILEPLIYGGGQERGLRSGTENVAGVVGFAEALKLAATERHERITDLRKLKQTYTEIIRKELSEVNFTVPSEKAAPHILHFSVPGLDAERLLYSLDTAGVIVATGAACAANKQTGSHVLKAIGMSDEAIQGSIRCSFGYALNCKTIEKAARTLVDCARRL